MKTYLKMLLIMAAACLGMATGARCQTQGLTGTFTNPDGTKLNGYLRIGMQGASFKNTCTTPYQVVPTTKTTYQIVNGVLQGGASTAQFVSTDCMMPRYPYVADVSDANNQPLYSSNWYLSRVEGSVINVGDLSSEQVGSSPIAVALPIGIISTPSVSQVVTQPSGTTFTFNGAVIFNGPVTFTAPFTFDQLFATQSFIGPGWEPGVSTSVYPLTVSGIIDAVQGFVVNGVSGPAGTTCLVSNGLAFVPGACGPAFPAIFFQQEQVNNVAMPQMQITNLQAPFISSTTNSLTSVNNYNFAYSGPGNFLVTTPSGLSNTGCIIPDGTGGITSAAGTCSPPTAAVCNSNGCYIQYNDGTLLQWGGAGSCGASTSNCTISVVFPHAFTSTTNLRVVATVVENSGSDNNWGAMVHSKSTTGFILGYGAFLYTGCGGSCGLNLNGSQTADWYAIGK